MLIIYRVAGPTDGHCDSETSWLHQSIIPGMQSSAAVCRRLRLPRLLQVKLKLLNASAFKFAAAAASASCCCSGFLLLCSDRLLLLLLWAWQHALLRCTGC